MTEKLIITTSTEIASEPDVLLKKAIRPNPMESLEAYKAQLKIVAQLLEERFSHVPFYAAKAAKAPSFWENWADSRINYG